jgi:hypothetical protein
MLTKWFHSPTPGVGVVDNNMDFTILFAPVGTTDPLSSVGIQFGLAGGAANSQVATNGVTSVGAPRNTLAAMLSGGGWQAVTNESGASLAVGTLVGSGKTAGTFSYNGGAAFQFNGGSATADVAYEMIVLAWDSTDTSFSSAADLGWSNPFTYTTGSVATDGNATTDENVDPLNQFGVAQVGSVPEPTTLALAGLGGLSMLFLRRRKA